ncbi:hypothetical protein ES288_D08G149200v1 [Gossypium darwinii]|uniref:Putative plant transposon protein domain-containing protein n=1 Tax=Gossypium darwinii TaxID=34276 RepID=A0A5D2BP91_GOSDA|nr:hypothetical protein ES288_D08G149200v1 [Gossypium darwinii]
MSRKRTRSSKTSTENPVVIQDEEARERFDSIFRNQPMMLEKAFNLESNYKMVMPLSIRKTINALNWEQFYDAHSMSNKDLVREFYANLTTLNANEVLVHKKKVPLTSKPVNDLFNLPNVQEDEYSAMMTNINWDFIQQVFNMVTNPGSQWIIRKYGIHSCRREYLNPVAKVWFYFIRYSFMLISHSSTILIERMILLYAIMIERSINFGRIILKEIQDYARKKTGNAYFPSLITLLY